MFQVCCGDYGRGNDFWRHSVGATDSAKHKRRYDSATRSADAANDAPSGHASRNGGPPSTESYGSATTADAINCADSASKYANAKTGVETIEAKAPRRHFDNAR